MTSPASAKVRTGVEAIDQLSGGLKRGRSHLLVGDSRSGKTTLGAQYLTAGLNDGERVIVVTRISAQEVVDRFGKLGYDYFAHAPAEGQPNDRLIIFEQSEEIVEHIRQLEDFTAVAQELEETIKEQQPARVLFDPVGYLVEAKTAAAMRARAGQLVDLLSRVQTTALLIVDATTDKVVAEALSELCDTVMSLENNSDSPGTSVLSIIKSPDQGTQQASSVVTVSGKGIVLAPQRIAPTPTAKLGSESAPAAPSDYAASNRVVTIEEPRPTPVAPPPPPVLIPEEEPTRLAPERTLPSVRPIDSRERASDERYQVLVIDDDPATCNLISRALRQDCNVTAVNDGASGLEKLATNSYDLIVLDVNLPVVDGFNVCQHIRQTQWQVPIIIVTGTHLRAEDRLQSASAGGDLYLTKPFSVQELRLRVRQMIGRYRNVPEWVGAGAGVGLDSSMDVAIPEDQLLTFEDFLKRLGHQTERARSVGLPFSIVGCSLVINGNGGNGAKKVDRIIESLRSQIRERDVMTVTPDQQPFVLLSEANVDGVQVFIQRLRQSILTEVGTEPIIQWRTYPIDGDNPAELLSEVREDLRVELAATHQAAKSQSEEAVTVLAPPSAKSQSEEAVTVLAPPTPKAPVQTSPVETISAPPVIEKAQQAHDWVVAPGEMDDSQPADAESYMIHPPPAQEAEPFFEFVIEEEEMVREGNQTLSNIPVPGMPTGHEAPAAVPQDDAMATATHHIPEQIHEQPQAESSAAHEIKEEESHDISFEFDELPAHSEYEVHSAVAAPLVQPVPAEPEMSRELVLATESEAVHSSVSAQPKSFVAEDTSNAPVLEPPPGSLSTARLTSPPRASKPDPMPSVLEAPAVPEPPPAPQAPISAQPPQVFLEAPVNVPVHQPDKAIATSPLAATAPPEPPAQQAPVTSPPPAQPGPTPQPRWLEQRAPAAPVWQDANQGAGGFAQRGGSYYANQFAGATGNDNSSEQYRRIVESLMTQHAKPAVAAAKSGSPTARESFLQFLAGI